MASTNNNVPPKCKFCDEIISWDATLRANAQTTAPIDPTTRQKHVCDPEKKAAHPAKLEQAKQAAINMGTTNLQLQNQNNNPGDNPTHIQKIEEYNLTQVESLSRITDLLRNQQSKIELLDLSAQYLKYINGHIASIDKTLTEILNILSDKQATTPQQRQSEEEIIGGIQEQ